MQDGLSGFLKHVGSLTRFERLPINIEKIIHTVFRWLGIKIYQKNIMTIMTYIFVKTFVRVGYVV